MERNLKSRMTINRLCYKGLDVFAKKGYRASSLDDILKELNLSKGAFYHHFKSKEEYFIYIVQNLVSRKVFSLLIEPLNTKDNPVPVILDTIEAALQPNAKNEMAYGFLMSDFLSEFDNKNDEIGKYLQDIISLWEVNLISLLKKGKLDGYFARHVDCEGVATFIIASYLGMRTTMKGSNSKQTVYQYMQQLKSYFNSLKPIQTYA